MSIVSAWLRLELRRHWRSLAVLALLIAAASTTVTASLAGARRGASAQQRLDARTLRATAMILPNTPGFDWAPIRTLPEVNVLSNFVVDNTMTGVDVSSDNIGFPFVDDNFMSTIERPVIFSGRAVDPRRADEAMVTRQFVTHFHKGLGDTATIILPTPQEIVNQAGSGPNGSFTGPRVVLHIVGVGETSATWDADLPGSPGGLQPSPGLYANYPQNIVGPKGANSANYVNALVRLRGGEAAIPQLVRDVGRVTGRSDIEVTDLLAQERILQHNIAFESRCLLAFAVAALVAGLLLIGQAIARYSAANTEDLRTLCALGMTPRQASGCAAAGAAFSGLIGAIAGVAGAVVASRWLPYGSAGLIEPSPGMSWDWVVFGPGLAVVIALVCAGAALAAWAALRAGRRAGTIRRSSVAAAVARANMPVPVAVGTRFALEAGRGRTAVPVRPALVGAVVGVLGIVGAFTFAHGVTDAATHRERFGETYQLVGFVGFNGADAVPSDKLLSALRGDASVSGVDDARTAVATGPDGHDSISLYAYSPGPKAIPLVILSGRLPQAAEEVVLAPQTLAAAHLHVGSHVRLTGNRGTPVSETVVGSGLVPPGPHNGYANGGWVSQHGYDALFSGFKFHFVLVTLNPGARMDGSAQLLDAAVGKADKSLSGFAFVPPDPLPELAELREVEHLPILLGGFLALLAVGAVGHALATAVRRREHDLAVLRALGMTAWQCRWVVATQATVLACIGLLFGIPLGLAAGRSLWRVVADYTPLAYVPPLAFWALALVGPATLGIANALAAWPGRRAARLRVAQVLRAE